MRLILFWIWGPDSRIVLSGTVWVSIVGVFELKCIFEKNLPALKWATIQNLCPCDWDNMKWENYDEDTDKKLDKYKV